MKKQILDILKTSDDFISGEDLSRQLGVTRAAVWKVIHNLRREGYPIKAVTNRGYRLTSTPDVLSRDEIAEMLMRNNLDSIVSLAAFEPSAGSTNQLARLAADLGALDMSLFIAERQTAGRGRRGKSWLSDSQEGLWLSLLLRPVSEAADTAKITLFTGLCVTEALNRLGAQTGIKWPNDVVSKVSGRKLGGILTEMIVEENQVSALIIGIGINVSTQVFDPEIAATATSLRLEASCDYRRIEVLAAILTAFASRYPDFAAGGWIKDYQQLCLTLGRQVLVIQADGTRWEGQATDLDDDGELIVINQAGEPKTVRSGEVSVRGLLGNS